MIDGNKSLGRFVLDGIPPAPRGIPQIEVIFNIDANGILNVTAKDKGTAKEQSITISGSGNLSKDDVEKMAKEAESHADEDKQRKEQVEARNLIDSAIYQGEKLAKDNKDKLSEDDQKTLDEAITEAKKTVDNAEASKEELEKAAQELNDKLMPIGAKMYEDASKDAASDEDKSASDEKKDDSIEGEVVEEKEDKSSDKK
jgi:molecular chaperone DnaK